MPISTISFQHFRNLQDTSLIFDPCLNFITGMNASGKTSLLEALYYLSTGRSFRSRKIESIITEEIGAITFTLFGLITEIKSNTNINESKIGIQKHLSNKTVIRLNGDNIQSASKLAKLSPIVIIDPYSFDLLNGPPKLRRQFLDWGVFHVEHSFSKIWNDYIYCLKQRNTLLRTAKIDCVQLDAWDIKIAEYGERVHASRSAYAGNFISELNHQLKIFSIDANLTAKYINGWDEKTPYLEFLKQSRNKDIIKRFTQYGPHRADIRILLNSKPVYEVFSRGQQKLLVIAMYLASIRCLSKQVNKNTVVLIDDIGAELDRVNLGIVFDSLLALNTQIIMTSLDSSAVNNTIFTRNKCNMFHVEHGKIKVKE